MLLAWVKSQLNAEHSPSLKENVTPIPALRLALRLSHCEQRLRKLQFPQRPWKILHCLRKLAVTRRESILRSTQATATASSASVHARLWAEDRPMHSAYHLYFHLSQP
jgi:hypothetical protein